MTELIKVATSEEESYIDEQYELRLDGETIGWASVMVSDTAYVERIDIDENYRNRGFGTKMLKDLSSMYGSVAVAPDNEDARRLYERIGEEYEGDDYEYIDQGFGVYEI